MSPRVAKGLSSCIAKNLLSRVTLETPNIDCRLFEWQLLRKFFGFMVSILIIIRYNIYHKCNNRRKIRWPTFGHDGTDSSSLLCDTLQHFAIFWRWLRHMRSVYLDSCFFEINFHSLLCSSCSNSDEEQKSQKWDFSSRGVLCACIEWCSAFGASIIRARRHKLCRQELRECW
jgi:hypothetical protein